MCVSLCLCVSCLPSVLYSLSVSLMAGPGVPLSAAPPQGVLGLQGGSVGRRYPPLSACAGLSPGPKPPPWSSPLPQPPSPNPHPHPHPSALTLIPILLLPACFPCKTSETTAVCSFVCVHLFVCVCLCVCVRCLCLFLCFWSAPAACMTY